MDALELDGVTTMSANVLKSRLQLAEITLNRYMKQGLPTPIRVGRRGFFVRRTRLRRRGSKGVMLCYRKIVEPIGKIKIVEQLTRAEIEAGGKTKTLLESFGGGGQFVAYGAHPITGP